MIDLSHALHSDNTPSSFRLSQVGTVVPREPFELTLEERLSQLVFPARYSAFLEESLTLGLPSALAVPISLKSLLQYHDGGVVLECARYVKVDITVI